MANKNLFGKKATDKVTNFTGIIVGGASYITGCDQYLVQPTTREGSNFEEGRWFDEGRLEIGNSFSINPQDVSMERPGADKEAPKK